MASNRQNESEVQIILRAGLFGGVLGVVAVLAGAKFNIPGFSIFSGFWGTDFLSDFLYALGSDTRVLTFVAAIWFFYGAMIAGCLAFLVGLLLRMVNRTDDN